LAQSKKNIEKTKEKKNKKNNIPEVLGMGGGPTKSFQILFFVVFLGFSMFF